MGMLSMQVLTLTVTMPILKVFKENIVPWFLRALKETQPRTWWELEQGLTSSPSDPSIRISSDTTVDEFVNKVMMYGMVTMFATAMPLAPLFFYFTNYIEFAFLGSRRLKHSRRILGLKAANIGKWDSIIVVINVAAVITNGFLMIITHGSLPDFLVYNSSFAKIKNSCGETYALIIFEHAIIAYMCFLHFSVPDTPQMVQFKHYATSQVVAKTFHVNLEAENKKDRARPSSVEDATKDKMNLSQANIGGRDSFTRTSVANVSLQPQRTASTDSSPSSRYQYTVEEEPTRRVTTQFNEYGAWLKRHRFVHRARIARLFGIGALLCC
jgi:hypothetical protein